jgi:mRNA interferase MazF
MVDFNPARGSEQAGIRPAIVISNDVNNQHSPNVIIAALTSQQVQQRSQTPINVFVAAGDLPQDSVILGNQIMTVSKDRLERHRGQLTAAQTEELANALRLSLGLRTPTT